MPKPKSKTKNSPFQMDSYHSRSQRVESLYSPSSVYAKMWFGNLAVLAFVFIDLFCLKVVWNLVQTESPMYVYCVAFACAAALDVPLAIAAIQLKKYHQGLCSKKEKNLILVLSVAVFFIAFIFSFGFRIVTGDLSFSVGSGSTLVNTMADSYSTSDQSSAVMFAAMFNGIIPLLTSLSSFVISYFGYDPLNMRLMKLQKERVGIQNNLIEAEKAVAQAENTNLYCVGMIARENDLYHAFLDQLDAAALYLKELARTVIMEKMKTAEDVSAMSESGQKLIEKTGEPKLPGQEYLAAIREKIKEKKAEPVPYIKAV